MSQMNVSKLVENYFIFEQIGEGQFSKVHKGKHVTTGEPVAVKILDAKKYDENPHIQTMISEEIEALSRISSPYVIKHFRYLRTSNNMYEVYDFFEQGDLNNHLNRYGRLSVEASLKIFRDLVYGVQAMYENNVIHRDLKPENIFLRDGTAVIGDFGLCRILDSKYQQIRGPVGSPMYMSPESLKKDDYGLKSDLYSLGIILYEMIHGTVPYSCKTIEDLLDLIDSEGPRFDQQDIDLPIGVKNLILRLLEPNPSKRIDHYELFEIVLNDQMFLQTYSNHTFGEFSHQRSRDSAYNSKRRTYHNHEFAEYNNRLHHQNRVGATAVGVGCSPSQPKNPVGMSHKDNSINSNYRMPGNQNPKDSPSMPYRNKVVASPQPTSYAETPRSSQKTGKSPSNIQSQKRLDMQEGAKIKASMSRNYSQPNHALNSYSANPRNMGCPENDEIGQAPLSLNNQPPGLDKTGNQATQKMLLQGQEHLDMLDPHNLQSKGSEGIEPGIQYFDAQGLSLYNNDQSNVSLIKKKVDVTESQTEKMRREDSATHINIYANQERGSRKTFTLNPHGRDYSNNSQGAALAEKFSALHEKSSKALLGIKNANHNFSTGKNSRAGKQSMGNIRKLKKSNQIDYRPDRGNRRYSNRNDPSNENTNNRVANGAEIKQDSLDIEVPDVELKQSGIIEYQTAGNNHKNLRVTPPIRSDYSSRRQSMDVSPTKSIPMSSVAHSMKSSKSFNNKKNNKHDLFKLANRKVADSPSVYEGAEGPAGLNKGVSPSQQTLPYKARYANQSRNNSPYGNSKNEYESISKKRIQVVANSPNSQMMYGSPPREQYKEPIKISAEKPRKTDKSRRNSSRSKISVKRIERRTPPANKPRKAVTPGQDHQIAPGHQGQIEKVEKIQVNPISVDDASAPGTASNQAPSNENPQRQSIAQPDPSNQAQVNGLGQQMGLNNMNNMMNEMFKQFLAQQAAQSLGINATNNSGFQSNQYQNLLAQNWQLFLLQQQQQQNQQLQALQMVNQLANPLQNNPLNPLNSFGSNHFLNNQMRYSLSQNGLPAPTDPSGSNNPLMNQYGVQPQANLPQSQTVASTFQGLDQHPQGAPNKTQSVQPKMNQMNPQARYEGTQPVSPNHVQPQTQYTMKPAAHGPPTQEPVNKPTTDQTPAKDEKELYKKKKKDPRDMNSPANSNAIPSNSSPLIQTPPQDQQPYFYTSSYANSAASKQIRRKLTLSPKETQPETQPTQSHQNFAKATFNQPAYIQSGPRKQEDQHNALRYGEGVNKENSTSQKNIIINQSFGEKAYNQLSQEQFKPLKGTESKPANRGYKNKVQITDKEIVSRRMSGIHKSPKPLGHPPKQNLATFQSPSDYNPHQEKNHYIDMPQDQNQQMSFAAVGPSNQSIQNQENQRLGGFNDMHNQQQGLHYSFMTNDVLGKPETQSNGFGSNRQSENQFAKQHKVPHSIENSFGVGITPTRIVGKHSGTGPNAMHLVMPQEQPTMASQGSRKQHAPPSLKRTFSRYGLNDWIEEVIYQRSKYKMLINVAKKTAEFKESTPLSGVIVFLLMKQAYNSYQKAKNLISIGAIAKRNHDPSSIFTSPKFKTIESVINSEELPIVMFLTNFKKQVEATKQLRLPQKLTEEFGSLLAPSLHPSQLKRIFITFSEVLIRCQNPLHQFGSVLRYCLDLLDCSNIDKFFEVSVKRGEDIQNSVIRKSRFLSGERELITQLVSQGVDL